MVAVSSWGQLDNSEHNIVEIFDRHKASIQIKDSSSGIVYGMGRSYGDVCLNPNGVLWKATGLDRYISFDEVSGRLSCEAGVLLRDIQRLTLPRGWILPVTPGTQLITLGGAIANDVHGKNHHAFGSFGCHILQLTVLRTDGTIIKCGPQLNNDWFSATVGGIGLTGVILSAEIQLQPTSGPWLELQTISFSKLSEFFDLAEKSELSWQHTVSWIDCISGNGRGIFLRANPSNVSNRVEPKTEKQTFPFVPPISLVNNLSLRVFNEVYYNVKKCQRSKTLIHYEPFFYPLDNLLKWNRLYGPKGFYQYQCVVPREDGKEAIQAMLDEISHSKEGSFLAVLKTFGDRKSIGMLSFPRPGITLALDFPNRGERTEALFKRLDTILREVGGRIYLAKDARMPRDLFESGYPLHTEFLKYRDKGISSAMSRRLMGY